MFWEGIRLASTRSMGWGVFCAVTTLLLSTSRLQAAGATVSTVHLTGTNIDLSFSSQTDSYYRVYHSTNLMGTWLMTDMKLGAGGSLSWTGSVPAAIRGRFYKVSKILQASPLDGDADGIDDVYELNRSFLNPLSSGDALTDYDNDGIQNLSEYIRNTDPNNAASVNTTIYANSTIGSAAYDGYMPTVVSATRGPKSGIQSALATAINGDTVQVAAGTYPEPLLNIGTNNVTLIPNGNVVIP